MSDLKLEVEKSYKTRSGGAVKIVDIESMIPPVSVVGAPYVGDNGKFYAENGRFANSAQESNEDLVEEISE